MTTGTTTESLHARIAESLARQRMMRRRLGARPLRVAPGECEIALPYSERVTQQQGGFHGRAIGALVDIAGGGVCALVQQTIAPVPKHY